MKVLTILGARPQFVKAAPVSRALHAAGHREFLVHTGQHYDPLLSDVFFGELSLPEPAVNLGIGSGGHGAQTGRMLAALEPVMQAEAPDWVVVYGDTNSTLAGALAAAKLNLRLAHVEAGLRSFDRTMPEEVNRVVSDHCADLLLCPTETAVANLTREGLQDRARLVGDPMLEALQSVVEGMSAPSATLNRLGLEPRGYLLVTIHRPVNADHPQVLRRMLDCLLELDLPSVFPVHPRTRPALAQASIGLEPRLSGRVHFVDPVGYHEMLTLERHARAVLTDSGGVQKEAYFLAVPCVTLRTTTEWPETLTGGWNELADPERTSLLPALTRQTAGRPPTAPRPLFGDGRAAAAIARAMEDAS